MPDAGKGLHGDGSEASCSTLESGDERACDAASTAGWIDQYAAKTPYV